MVPVIPVVPVVPLVPVVPVFPVVPVVPVVAMLPLVPMLHVVSVIPVVPVAGAGEGKDMTMFRRWVEARVASLCRAVLPGRCCRRREAGAGDGCRVTGGTSLA